MNKAFSFRKSRRNSGPTTTPKMAMLGRNEEEESLFDLILKLQGGARMENQRSSGPRLGGNIIDQSQTLSSRQSSFATPAPPPPPAGHISLTNNTPTSSMTASDTGRPEPVYETPEPEVDMYEAPKSTTGPAPPRPLRPSSIASSAGTGADSLQEDHRHPQQRSASLHHERDSASQFNGPRRAASHHTTSRPLPATPPRPSLRRAHRSSSSAAAADNMIPEAGLAAERRKSRMSLCEPCPEQDEETTPPTISEEEHELRGFQWYLGAVDRKEAEDLLRAWPTGTFAVRKGRSSRVITLKFPVAKDKVFFHVRITYEEPMYRVADSECFRSIPELVAFYVDQPHRFFRGMAPEERLKHQLSPYCPVPTLQLDIDASEALGASEA
ncbi:uncharacterized protein MONBRDRAFT_12142 [Monosiga brevicollis MX1]|uniref:SH2 domain-containing protein n=1 Tax=Monosiga brevicollis TaxID=81824 RepID=A9VBC5_MONBE|nr:uncharacterized protein MONBRDRAFT_12142 [Monosiga brevicollis MX1]EDQ85212.1 predicted protein [Monosiga brevicollis MX1]|eukprot:XP_001750037.1 hypothetical protein [Monosiga brevicollis MX1]